MVDERNENKETLEWHKARLEHLDRQYGFYTAHMNQVFNFYLITAALIASAFVQSLSGPNPLQAPGPQGIALGGALRSLLFFSLHMRGFHIADKLDQRIRAAEGRIDIDFMTEREQSHKGGPFKNTFLFASIYVGFFMAFVVAVACAEHVRAPQRAAQQPAVTFDSTAHLLN